MPDFIYDIRDKLLDALDTVRSYIPANLEEYTPYAVPGAAALLSGIAILLSVLSGKTANQLEARAHEYQTGQAQIEATLGTSEPIDMSETAVEDMGRSDLMLHYRQLSLLPGETNFTNMEHMANVSSSAEDAAEYDRDQSFYDLIPNFAGAFGGVLAKRSVEGTEPDIRMAAYKDEADMSAPEDPTVMNVLVQHLTRVIPSTQYGVSDIRNTLVVLSGTDIRKFSVLGKGSVMYTLFGESEGTKVSRKYICTGIEPGTLDSIDQNGITELASESNTTISTQASSAEAAESAESGVEAAAGEDAMPHTGPSDIKSTKDDGTAEYEDGMIVYPNGVVKYSDNTVVDKDGNVYYTDGMIIAPDGTISGGVLSSNDGEGEEGSGAQDAQEGAEGGESSYDSSNLGSDGREFAGEADSIFTRHVYAANGQDITSDKTHDLIFYMINSQTGTVTITYWNLAGSDMAEAALSEFNY